MDHTRLLDRKKVEDMILYSLLGETIYMEKYLGFNFDIIKCPFSKGIPRIVGKVGLSLLS